jgi:regulator of sigma E protease
MNWVLAAVLFSIVLMVGVVSELEPNDPLIAQGRVQNRQVAISYVEPGGRAEAAGLKTEDFIVTIDGRSFETSGQVQEYISSNKGKTFEFTVKRINETKTISVESNPAPEPGRGATGITLTDIGTIKLPFFTAIAQGVEHTFVVTEVMYKGVADLVSGKVALNNVGGPVKIAQLTGQVADLGLVALMNFTAFLSINLAILNILPLPALDGGRVLFLIVEKLRGKRNSQKVEQFANTVGFVLLLLLMLLVTIKDIRGL